MRDGACFNDITKKECREVLDKLAESDEKLKSLIQQDRLRLVGTGSIYPQLNFKAISAECNEAAAGADLMILTGLARAIESNFNERFCPATLKMAVVKDRWEAQKLGGELFDLVCRFEPARKEIRKEK